MSVQLVDLAVVFASAKTHFFLKLDNTDFIDQIYCKKLLHFIVGNDVQIDAVVVDFLSDLDYGLACLKVLPVFFCLGRKLHVGIEVE